MRGGPVRRLPLEKENVPAVRRHVASPTGPVGELSGGTALERLDPDLVADGRRIGDRASVGRQRNISLAASLGDLPEIRAVRIDGEDVRGTVGPPRVVDNRPPVGGN